MYWVTRGNSEYLYLKTRKDGGRLATEYLGTGLTAFALWNEEQIIKRKKRKRLKEEAEEKASWWPLEVGMKLIREAAKEAIESAYLGTNHYKSKCHHWRRLPEGASMGRKKKRQQRRKKKRERKKQIEGVAKVQAAPPSAQAKTVILDGEHKRKIHPRSQAIIDTIQAVKAGRNEQRSELRRLLLESDPSIWKDCSNVFRMTADQWAARIAGGNNPLVREAILLKANIEREELAPTDSSSVERVLADRLVLSRLQQQYFELQAAAVGGDPDVIGSKLGDALHKRLSSSTRELNDATRHYEKAKQLKAEILPTRPNSGTVALKVYNPNSKRKSA